MGMETGKVEEWRHQSKKEEERKGKWRGKEGKGKKVKT